jgi:transcriptional regulator with XRE-family HTH domain
MNLKAAFAEALRAQRVSHGLSQEDFAAVSCRTYLSALERGLKCPTLEKVEALASVLEMHPLSLIADCYMRKEGLQDVWQLFEILQKDLVVRE